MALVLADRVLETTSVAGTGDASLSGAIVGYQPFSVIGGGNTTYYTIVAIDDNGSPTGDWEVGIGTYVTSGNKVSRDTVLSSSNGGALVYFASGNKQIFLDLPSEEVLLSAGDVTGPASAVADNFAAFNLTTGKLIKDSGYNASSFATAAQGAKADTAVQPGSLGSAAYLTAGAANGVATLDAGGKVPTSQIPQMGDLNYQGTWNASTNTPTLTSSAGTKGFYYVVSVAGSTNLNGITDWKIGDWAVFNGSVWEKIDNTDAVTSVNGYTGTVVLTASDVGAQPAGAYVTSVGATSPVTSSGGTTPTIAMPAATTSVSGYLTSTDWNTFNNKSSTTGTVTSITAGTGLTGGTITSSGTIAIDSTVVTLTDTQTLTNKTLTSPKVNELLDANGNEVLGLLSTTSATDYLAIKNGIGVGVPLHISSEGSSSNIGLHIQPKGTGLVTISDGADFNKGIRFRSSGSASSAITLLDAVASAGRVVTLPDATTTLVGRDTTDTLTNKSISGSTNTLSNIGNASLTNSAITINGTSTSLGGSISVGTVTSVTGTAPVVSSGGATPAISMAAATTSVNGYLTSTDWNTFNNKGSGTVTSVGGTGTVNGITLTGTVTSTGNLTLGGTLGGIGNSQLTNSAVTIGSTSVSLGATATTLAGLTSVTSTTVVASGVVGTSATGALTMPSGTTAERPASPVTGMIRYNTTTGVTEYYNGTTWYSITATLPTTSTVEYLVVAGGGGGGLDRAGGGGAGGYKTASGFSVASGSAITVTVGGGGAGATSAGSYGGNGGNSVFSSVTSTGGGAGGTNGALVAVGAAGGSGGGGRGGVAPTTLGGAASPAGQGNAGGTGNSNDSGGGGGAGAVGGNATGGGSGSGGVGLSTSISGSSTFYAGGGGGGVPSGSPGRGGNGGGGNGTGGSTGGSGTANTGGGGGGGGSGNGGPGGSGIVIIRYADTFAPAASTTGSPTITVAGGYRVYTWTGSGTITF